MTNCDCCVNYVYDDEYDCYTCEQGAELDEDEMAQFLRGDYPACPFYHPGESDYYLSSKQPYCVMETFFPMRSNRRTPSSRSSCWICTVTADWE